MSQRKPLVVAFTAQISEALSGLKKMTSAVTGFGKASESAQEAVDGLADKTKEEAKEAGKALAGLGVKTDAVADQQIAALKRTQEQLKDWKKSGAISADEFARAFKTAETRITAINKGIARDARTTAEKIQQTMSGLGRSLRSVGGRITAIGAASVGAGAGAVGAGVGAVQGAAFETQNAALSAGMVDPRALQQFQGLAFAASSVGIETEALGAILKDTNDKMGEYLTTGGGELADFFENIAPKVGVTAEMFRGLNSADALQLYVTTLERAGLGQQGFTRYLEAMADESTRLLPLLRNNGAEMKRLADIGAASGAYFDDEDIKSAAELRESMALLRGSIQGLGIAMMEAGVTDALVALIDKTREIVTWIKDNVSPEFLKFGTIVAGITLVVGPLVIAAGLLLGALAAMTGLAAGSIAAIAAIGVAIVAVGSAIYVWWDDLVSFFTESIPSFFGGLLDGITGLISGAFSWMWDKAVGLFDALVGLLPDWLTGDADLTVSVPEAGGMSSRTVAMAGAAAPSGGLTGNPVVLNVGGSSYQMAAAPDVVAALTTNQNIRRARTPVSTPRTFK